MKVDFECAFARTGKQLNIVIKYLWDITVPLYQD